MRNLTIAALVACAVGANAGSTLFDNGPWITHAGMGAGGADVSMASSGTGTTGPNTAGLAAHGAFGISDDFTIGPGETWNIDSIRLMAYQTNSAPGAPTWTGYTFNIYNDVPGGTLVGGSTTGVVTWSGDYRVFNGATNLLNTARALNFLEMDTTGLSLGTGNYWWTLQVATTGTAWMNMVMDPNPAAPDDPITRVGNAQQFNATWAPTGFEHPFVVTGTVVPEPGTFIAIGIGLAGLALARRRK